MGDTRYSPIFWLYNLMRRECWGPSGKVEINIMIEDVDPTVDPTLLVIVEEITQRDNIIPCSSATKRFIIRPEIGLYWTS
jgi:hypothetical protein